MSLELSKLEALMGTQNAMIAKQNQLLAAQNEMIENLRDIVGQIGIMIGEELGGSGDDDNENFGYDLSGKPIPN